MRLVFLLLIAVLCACTSTQAPVFSTRGHVEEASELVAKSVALVARVDGELKAYCSGVWVSPTTIATANHCMREDELGSVVDYVVRSDIYAPGEVQERPAPETRGALLYARDELHDLALLRALVPPPHATARVTAEVVRPGMFVQTMGQPLGLWWSYSSGDVAAVRHMPSALGFPMLMIQTTAPTSPGNSGGALFDSHGQIVGICHGSFTKGQSLNLFIHWQYVDALMRRQVNL
jgi:S1-C subfamily serine protease